MLCAVCILILVNYGPIMCITSLFLFSRYRKAVVVMVYKLLTREIPLKCIAVNCVTLTIIAKNTPKHMRSFALFLLNIMIWNFAANLILVVAHPFPMHPLVCFRLDGLCGLIFEIEIIGHVVFGLILLIVVNVATAIFISFQFRFTAIACQRYTAHIRPKWAYIYCFGLHSIFSVIFVAFYQSWTMSMASYPGKIEDAEDLFCFAPERLDRFLFLAYFFIFIFLIVSGVILFVFLSFLQLHKNKKIIKEKTLQMQKVLLWNLIILAAIPITLGGLPLLIAISSVFFHDIPFGQLLCAVCMLVLVNYGPIMCITSLLLFRKYKQAVVVVVYKLLKKEIPSKWLGSIATATPSQFRTVTTGVVPVNPASTVMHKCCIAVSVIKPSPLQDNWIQEKQTRPMRKVTFVD
ncbi:hypothetical protein L596_012585 [Steinernema carpocapsae]|uniref:G-protein coupled receptors family 1 profile domain-containing protein n=1 Tax=Steinernema carpocapsae TaxID=34508 RepID=A0A4U5NXI9_STECR|nr:hypothetical protein L596_012585 [Steinernema carpocapsae]